MGETANTRNERREVSGISAPVSASPLLPQHLPQSLPLYLTGPAIQDGGFAVGVQINRKDMAMQKAQMTTYKPAAHFFEQLEISRTTWWRWTKTPGFPEPIRFGKSVRWPVEEVEQYLKSNTANS